jgi:DNA-binding transcriptional LysR family regulator
VKISEAGKLFLNDARRILQEVNDATARAKRIACGLAGTLRVGFVESISWQGIVPDSIRDFRERRPDVKALSSLEQIAAIQSGSLDAGYAVPLANPDHGLAHFQVGVIKTVLAVPKGHALTKQRKIRLRDLVDLLATPGTEACDAVGGALRPEWREWPATES